MECLDYKLANELGPMMTTVAKLRHEKSWGLGGNTCNNITMCALTLWY